MRRKDIVAASARICIKCKYCDIDSGYFCTYHDLYKKEYDYVLGIWRKINRNVRWDCWSERSCNKDILDWNFGPNRCGPKGRFFEPKAENQRRIKNERT